MLKHQSKNISQLTCSLLLLNWLGRLTLWAVLKKTLLLTTCHAVRLQCFAAHGFSIQRSLFLGFLSCIGVIAPHTRFWGSPTESAISLQCYKIWLKHKMNVRGFGEIDFICCNEKKRATVGSCSAAVWTFQKTLHLWLMKSNIR